MPDRALYASMQMLLDDAPSLSLTKEDRLVIFSDLHLGDGGRRDDFLPNAAFFQHLLEHHYLPRDYHLILNGDVEELHKFTLRAIVNRWSGLYEIFREFEDRRRLTKIRGNHDLSLDVERREYPLSEECLDAVRIDYEGHTMLVFHGHQASMMQAVLGPWSERLVRHVVAPLGIRNPSASHDSRTRLQMEKRIYGFARSRGIAAAIGHTHRPLFESLSKIDSLRFQIEHYCRIYAASTNGIREELAVQIRACNQELQQALRANRKHTTRGGLYNACPLVPCLFNSGCVIGKRGMTAIEIAEGRIALVHWFDRRRSSRFFNRIGRGPEQLGDSDYFRVVLNDDPCNYLFARISLLT